MDLGITVSRARCALVWGAATLVAVALVTCLAPVVGEAAAAVRSGAAHRARFDEALVWGSAAVAAVVTGWLWVVTTLVVADAARGLPRPRWGVPEGVRRSLLVLCGAALTAGIGAPALATGGPAPGPEVLAGLRLPERVGVSATAPAARAAPLPAVATPPGRVTVAPGDTLWSLAAAQLGPATTPAEIARAWPLLYAANRDVIGPDPARIDPGQHLVLPPEGARRDHH